MYISKEPAHNKIIAGVIASWQEAIKRAQDTGTKLVVWRNGRVTEIEPIGKDG